ncbi:MAG: dephospho-CoA kinase, partial [Clostridia bacterium]|nr:dephospho-CoA kinase [Clostridia bacterium]
NQTVFVEVPLLFERKYENKFDNVLVITRPLKDRIDSVKTRSNLTEEQIKARINAQVNYEQIDLSPYTVIMNDGDKTALKEKVLDAVKKLTEE